MTYAAFRSVGLASALLIAIAAPVLNAQPPATKTPAAKKAAAPQSGVDVLERMHAAYDGKWYHTLTFVQKTTLRRRDGTDTIQTWYEALRHSPESGTRLRIDFGDPTEGNGVVYTPDSVYRVRPGQPAAASANGNEFLPLIEGVYVQPVARTVKELEPTKVDLKKVTPAKWEGRDAWAVGISSLSDTTSPQFWVEAERNVVVRFILVRPAPAPALDIHLTGYVALAGGWLATKIEMFAGGQRAQAEEYSDWKAGMPLDPALFEASKWATAKHWMAKR
jgi:hypothetical protein